MRKSLLNLANDLKARLLEFPALVNRLEKKDFKFLDELVSWIKSSEEILTKNNISEVSELAGLRSKLLSPKFSNSRGASVRKAQIKIASEILYDLQNALLKILQPSESKIEECRELIRQLLGIVNQSGAIRYNENMDFQSFIESIWSFFISHEQLKPGAVKLQTLTSKPDILRIMAEEIVLGEWT